MSDDMLSEDELRAIGLADLKRLTKFLEETGWHPVRAVLALSAMASSVCASLADPVDREVALTALRQAADPRVIQRMTAAAAFLGVSLSGEPREQGS